MDDTDFIETEMKQLNDLQKTFSPEQQIQYSEEVDYIKYLLNLLKKAEKAPDTKKNRDEKKKDKQKIEKALGQIVNNYTLSKATDITHEELSPEEILDAKFSKLSNKYYRLNGQDSDNYLAQEGIGDGWEINNELSNDKGLVLYNKNTKKAKVAFRGTDRGNLGDLEADARIYFGTEQNHEHFTSARQQMRNTIEAYGRDNTSTTGYSLGGNKSWSMGNEFGVNSTGFNPFIGKNIVNRPDNYKEGVAHKIIRTQDDLPSIQTAYLDGKNNTEVKVVSTLGAEINALNPYTAHSIDNFITNEGRSNSKNRNGVGLKMEQLAQHGFKHGELRTFDEMLKINDKNYRKRNTPKPKSTFQQDLEVRAENIPPPHLPKKPLSKKSMDEINNFEDAERFLRDYNSDGTPKIAEIPQPQKAINIRKQTQALEKSWGLNSRSSRNSYKSAPTIDTLGNETRALEEKMGIKKRTIRLDTKTRAEIKGLRSKINPPLEAPTPQSKSLNQQTENLENQIMELTPLKSMGSQLSPPQSTASNSTQPASFTEWATNNNVEPSSHKKGLWERSGGKLTPTEKANYPEWENNTRPDTFNSERELNVFQTYGAEDRENILEEHSKVQQNMEGELNAIDNSGIRASGGSYSMEVARGLHPQNLILGYLTGKASEDIMKNYVNKYVPNQPEILQVGETGAIAGGLTSAIMGTALAPEAAAGAVGYVAQKYSAEGIYKGLKYAGATEDQAQATAAVGGGAVGGTLAGLTAAFVGGAAVGGEDGAIAGGGVFSPEAGAIGGLIGGIIGAGSYAKAKYFS